MHSKPETLKESNHLKFTRLRIIKNLIIISCTFVLLFSAYDGLSMLQSTMNGKEGVGSASQAVVYSTFAIASLLLPKYTIKKLGCKRTLVLGTVLYWPYIAANIYPTWITMMSSAVLIGIGASVLWASQCTYFNEAAGLYCSLVDDCKRDKNSRNMESDDGKFKLFVIPNGACEKKPSIQQGLKSEDDETLNLDYKESHRTECTDDSKCSSVKNILENVRDLETIKYNQKLQHGKEEDVGAKYKNNFNTGDNELIRTNFSITPVNTEKHISVLDMKANIEILNSQVEGEIFNEQSNHTVKGGNNELTMNNVSADKIKFPVIVSINKKTLSDDTLRLCSVESITARFFGFFGTMYYTAQVWSNLITYYVLNSNVEQNATFISNRSCGAGFCNSEYEAISGGRDEISYSTRYTLIGITVSLSVVSSFLVLVFVDPLDEGNNDVTFSMSHAMATFNHLKSKEQLYIIPLSMFAGMAQGFYTADFTKSYIQCAWSISYVGLVSVFYGLAGGIASTMSGCVVKYVGRIPVVLFGLTFHFGIDIFLLIWKPDEENHFMLYLAAALFGAKVAIFWSQTQAFYGLLFKSREEAAYATHNLCSAIGWTISFAYSDYLCTSTKIYILMIMSCLGICGYLTADRSFRSRKTSQIEKM